MRLSTTEAKLLGQGFYRPVVRTKEEIERDLDKAKVQLRDDVVNMTLQLAERIIQEKLDQQKDRDLVAQLVDEMKQGGVEGFK